MCNCLGGANLNINFSYQTTEQSPPESCDYTISQLENWRDKLVCFKENYYYQQYNITPANLNKYLGIVLSAIHYGSNLCYFKSDLDKAQNLITIIENSNKCN